MCPLMDSILEPYACEATVLSPALLSPLALTSSPCCVDKLSKLRPKKRFAQPGYLHEVSVCSRVLLGTFRTVLGRSESSASESRVRTASCLPLPPAKNPSGNAMGKCCGSAGYVPTQQLRFIYS